MPKKIVAIIGTYRKGKTIDTAVDELLRAAQMSACHTEEISLLDKHIEFCTNCCNCTQQANQTLTQKYRKQACTAGKALAK
jgi:multimeric flavodoxin WrbA